MKNDFKEIDSSYIYNLCHYDPNPKRDPDTGRFISKDMSEALMTSGKEVTKLGEEIGKFPLGEKGYAKYKKYDALNDKELKNKIKRIKDERELSDLEGQTQYIKSGKEKTRELLQTIGSSLAIAGTVVSLLVGVKTLRTHKSSASHSDSNDIMSLCHTGVKGMKWGIRKKYYVNEDGSLTLEGYQKYGNESNYAKGVTVKQKEKERKAQTKLVKKVVHEARILAGIAALTALGIAV